MARSWEYSEGRRKIMQAVMWLVFAATSAGAIALSRARVRAMHVLLDGPRPLNLISTPVYIQMPRGWQIVRGRDADGSFFEAHEPGRLEDEPIGRQLIVSLKELDTVSIDAREYLLSHLQRLPLTVQPFKFKNFGEGVVMETPSALFSEGDLVKFAPPALYACTILPSSRTHPIIAAVIELKGPAALGPSAFELLHTVADSMVVR